MQALVQDVMPVVPVNILLLSGISLAFILLLLMINAMIAANA